MYINLQIYVSNLFLYLFFSQFIHHILFNVSTNKSFYLLSFFFQCHIAFILLMPSILFLYDLYHFREENFDINNSNFWGFPVLFLGLSYFIYLFIYLFFFYFYESRNRVLDPPPL